MYTSIFLLVYELIDCVISLTSQGLSEMNTLASPL